MIMYVSILYTTCLLRLPAFSSVVLRAHLQLAVLMLLGSDGIYAPLLADRDADTKGGADADADANAHAHAESSTLTPTLFSTRF